MFLVAASAWHLARRAAAGQDTELFRRAMRLGLVVTLVAGIATAVTGDLQARLMDSQQPMKMAAAEALYNTSSPASFSLFTVGSLNGNNEVWSVRVPYLLSLIATMDPNGTVRGINNVERAYEKKYGPGQLPAVRAGDVLVVPADDRLRHAGRAVQPGRAVADPPAPDPAEPLVLPGGHRRGGHPVPGQHHGLDLHRDGPPAVDGVRRAADLAERLGRRSAGTRC